MNNNKSVPKAGSLKSTCYGALTSFLIASSTVYAKNVDYEVFLGSPDTPANSITNAEYVTFFIRFAEPVFNITTSDFELFNGHGTAVIDSINVPASGGTDIELRVNTGGDGTRIAARVLDNASITDAVGGPLEASFPSGSVLRTYDIDKSPPGVTVSGPIYTLNQTPTIKGVAEAGATFKLLKKDTGAVLCDLTIPLTGLWECNVTTALAFGPAVYSVSATDAVGNVNNLEHTFTVLTSSGDEDFDGLNNADEEKLGTNPFLADSDGNNIPDSMEDNDGDGVTNGDEVKLGMNPLLADSDGDNTPDNEEDSDGDGVPDFLELKLGTDPNNTDSDGDGIADGNEDYDGDGLNNQLEVKLGLNPALSDTDGNNVSDANEDSDGDGLTNIEEIRLGLDPSNMDSDGDGNIDSVDTDWDNDGIPNSNEVPYDMLLDRDGDSVPAYLDDNDQDVNVKDDDGKVHMHFDHDRDGILNQLDADDDNDGISTLLESGTKDSDADGIPDYLESNINDSDGDGVKDHLDNDDEGDSSLTRSEVGSEVRGYLSLKDVDVDGIPDYLDADSVNAAGVTDGSGDSDKNGISDKKECPSGMVCPDLDLDGVDDYLDLDDDGDGILDVNEIGLDARNPLDSNNNGIYDYREQSVSANPSSGSVNTVINGGGSMALPLLLLVSSVVWFRRQFSYQVENNKN